MILTATVLFLVGSICLPLSSAAPKDGGWTSLALEQTAANASNKMVLIRPASAIGGAESGFVKAVYLTDILENLFLYDALHWGGWEQPPSSVKERGLYPDPVLTPGRCDHVKLEDLCSGNVKARRHVTELERLNVYAEYKITSVAPGEHYEVDHFCPVSLGGSNDIRNLWPQRYAPKPGAREKDVVETWLHREVCAHRMSLDSAQRAILADWLALYQQQQKEHK